MQELMLATKSTYLPPANGKWIYQIKANGIRAYWDGERLWTRQGLEFKHSISIALRERYSNCQLDGELILAGAGGLNAGPDMVKSSKKLVYLVFDVLQTPDGDIRHKHLHERLGSYPSWMDSKYVRFSYDTDIQDNVDNLKEWARKGDIEGIIAKHVNSRYEGGRSKLWLKWKPSYGGEINETNGNSKHIIG